MNDNKVVHAFKDFTTDKFEYPGGASVVLTAADGKALTCMEAVLLLRRAENEILTYLAGRS